jgi:hypothetical protein
MKEQVMILIIMIKIIYKCNIPNNNGPKERCFRAQFFSFLLGFHEIIASWSVLSMCSYCLQMMFKVGDGDTGDFHLRFSRKSDVF